ncbi:DUF1304 domain-containing protein [Leptospira sp. GIMC2001]|uniref:DUF1304 domain-containing protein n=1 Tax=Leptospira sp. GIMC2001 TaxID=1513297 RepID=UPI00234BE55A|nr:DUF1304 domain-containing protein [Leptospira sp. GIMC2001]WCL49478.1 DUF1304 domain-containing protein [Leptospira sp. GIMC2001]
MKLAVKILVVFVAVQHILFLVLEMFLWETAFGMKTFNLTPETASSSAKLAMNQGLYNGFLAAGLLWSVFFVKDLKHRFLNLNFFLICVLVAGVFGGFTAKISILFIQGLPALIALVLLNISEKK